MKRRDRKTKKTAQASDPVRPASFGGFGRTLRKQQLVAAMRGKVETSPAENR